MIKNLNNKEKSRVSGGWTCNDTYKGLPFKKAMWYIHTDHSKNEAQCSYQETDGGRFEYYLAPRSENLTEILPGRWSYVDAAGEYIIYKCTEQSASRCVLK